MEKFMHKTNLMYKIRVKPYKLCHKIRVKPYENVKYYFCLSLRKPRKYYNSKKMLKIFVKKFAYVDIRI